MQPFTEVPVASKLKLVLVGAVGVGLATGTLWAAAGVEITMKVTSGTDVQTMKAQLDKTHERAEIRSTTGANQIVLFDGAKEVLDIVNVDAKTYNELTKADVDRLAGQMQSAMDQMNAMMASMPEAQRAQMGAMMQGRMGAMAPPVKTEYRRNGTDKVGKWTCDKYDGYQNGQKVSEICTVAPAALGLALDDFAVGRQMMDMFSKLVPGGSSQLMAVGHAAAEGYDGIPVRSTSTVAGRTVTTEMVDVSRQTFPDSIFAVPAGYTRQDMPGMNGMMGGRGGRAGR
jgi:hypothetical protein